jgi:amidase/aspartyl-tRNA(Asn)/glutamyl-tRNA(Gln) amidotransferase subunit A
MADDLTEARRRIRARVSSASELVERAVAAAAAPATEPAFVATSPDVARAAAASADQAVASGRDPGPLAGLAVSLKDLFVVAGEVTAAGSTILRDAPPARADAPAVARLRAAGAAFVGRTHMSEFAFSGVGLNPHFPVLANRRPRSNRPRASPAVHLGRRGVGCDRGRLGRAGLDTGGSITSGGAQGVVGFKGTARPVPSDGAIPPRPRSTRSARTRCATPSSSTGARRAHGAARASAPSAWRFAVPVQRRPDGLDDCCARVRACPCDALGGRRVDRRSRCPVRRVASINATGGFAPVELGLPSPLARRARSRVRPAGGGADPARRKMSAATSS